MKKHPRARKIVQLFFLMTFPVTLNYLSPYLIVQGGFEGVLTGSAMVFAGLFITSLFLGRSFCSWVCPAGALQDVCAVIQPKRTGRRQNAVKYFIWAVWLGAIVAGFVSAGEIKEINLLYMTEGGISVNETSRYIIYFSVVLLLAGLSLTLGRRSPCHSICWMAPFLVLGTLTKEALRLPARRLTAEPSRCTGCKTCTKNCPMSLPVSEMVAKNRMFHTECILCGECRDHCPQQVLRVGFTGAQRAEEKAKADA